ncbi:MAG: hypothetical protein GY711_32460 [bacterium]|nr:hypothetical protein [bacterium]
MPARVAVLGSGKRVQQAVLPALFSQRESWELAGVWARTEKRISVGGEEVAVAPIETLDLAGIDLVIMTVAKPAVPAVLALLGELGAKDVDLLIDTPVLVYKLMGHLERLAPFRNVWVAEDTTRLPAFDAAAEAIESAAIGQLQRVVFEHAAWAYHGVAMGRRFFPGPVLSGRRKGTRRTLRYEGGGEVVIHDPRDYSRGRVRFEGADGVLTDGEDPDALRFGPVLDGAGCTGFHAGTIVQQLSPTERELMGPAYEDAVAPLGVMAFMEGMKRIGLARMLADIQRGHGVYALRDAIDDTVVDYHLDRFRRYRRNRFTHPEFGMGRRLTRVLTRIAGE